ncbi:HTH_Tnp_Tc3_2 domain-containing protein [Trichonephila clavipes]|nr:HTH_Tnp_Tc3_2 domain-containing protein [Trichonephila clavipes]
MEQMGNLIGHDINRGPLVKTVDDLRTINGAPPGSPVPDTIYLRVTCQSGRSDCVQRRCWVQWIREMSFTCRRDSGRPRQTSDQEDHHIVRNARMQATASSAAIHAQVAPSLGAPASSQTVRRRWVKDI